MSITVQLDLPDALAEKARAAGLLQEKRLTALIEEAVERDKLGREFISLLDQIRAQPGEPMSEEAIAAEIKAARAERRAREAGR